MRLDRKPEKFDVTGGIAELDNTSVMLVPHAEAGGAIFLGRYDIAELLRKMCDDDAAVLMALYQVMTSGHRFTPDEPLRPLRDDEEPF